jgi:hypothetical protein
VSPVKYELGFYIPEDGILHSHRRENLKSYTSVEHLFFGLPIPDIEFWVEMRLFPFYIFLNDP